MLQSIRRGYKYGIKAYEYYEGGFIQTSFPDLLPDASNKASLIVQD